LLEANVKIGMQLHADRGVDAVMEEARRADEQGFDSVWLSDHLMNTAGVHKPDGPLDYFVLMTAIGAVTRRVRLAWGILNVTFRPPALFAKMITSLDQITKGRVICTLGSGWYKEEYLAYNLPLLEDHDERAEYAREVIALFKNLWTHPAPQRTTFEGKYVHVRDLPFNPEPYQKPHPPIWLGGESEATLRTAKELGDGWVTLSAGGSRERLQAVLSASDWPEREMTVVKGARIVVRRTREEAVAAAETEYAAAKAATPQFVPPTFDEFLAREIVGSPEDCLQRIREIAGWGVNYLRVNFPTPDSQDAAAALLLPRLGEVAAAPAAG
jgi:alkanesulfonate monooxygenase SsuD/methylene tetrahydromethanopterin reductase-like flavin-dependent oxidoreductase (luciferase family)